MEQPASFKDMDRRARDGLALARKAAVSSEQADLIDLMEQSWDQISKQYLMLGVELTAMGFRTEAQIIERLEKHKQSLRALLEFMCMDSGQQH